jgi:hypothetical protein
MRKIYFYLIGVVFMICSCTEKTLEPINGSMGKPGIVTEVTTTPIPGGVIIGYRVPDAADLLSVKAEYTISSGKKMEAVASYYANHLTLEGFIDTLQHEAKLYAISRAQEQSDVVTVLFTPLESSLSKTAKSVEIISDFGGANFSWLNRDTATLTFDFQTPDKNGKMQTVHILTSNLDSAEYTVRGYQPEPRKFGLIISDNWGNSSQLILPDGGGLITPQQEDRMDKTIMKTMRLSGDAALDAWGFKDEYMFDEDNSTCGHTAEGALPAYFTVDLGKITKLSRLIMFQRLFQDQYFNHANPKYFDVYLCNLDKPSANGNLMEWTKIMTCTIEKPSGLSGTEVTNEDMRAGSKGHEFSFPRDMKPVRYLRFMLPVSTWGGRPYANVAELTFFGRYEE